MVTRKLKQIVYDLRTLRDLATYLLRYDAVTFLRYLETLRVAEGRESMWLLTDAAHVIFEQAKRRVYVLRKNNAGPAPGVGAAAAAGAAAVGGGAGTKRKTAAAAAARAGVDAGIDDTDDDQVEAGPKRILGPPPRHPPHVRPSSLE